MSLKSAILNTSPTSYWPLDDKASSFCHDEMGLHDATLPASGITLAAIPFGASSAPFFDGEIGSRMLIDNDPKYSQPFANALTVAAWICPLALNNAHTAGAADQWVYVVEKAASPVEVEWALRLYNRTNPKRHSRLSFYAFGASHIGGSDQGSGSYMEHGVSKNDKTPVDAGSWLFLVGQMEPFILSDDETTGCIIWKQNVEATRIVQDKYFKYDVQPQMVAGGLSVGGTTETGFKGAIGHLAIWNRLLGGGEIASMWTAGIGELRATPMYHSFV